MSKEFVLKVKIRTIDIVSCFEPTALFRAIMIGMASLSNNILGIEVSVEEK